jgi:hypothetical protein
VLKSILAIIAFLLPFVIEALQQRKDTAIDDSYREDIKSMEQDIAHGDAAGISVRFDDLRIPQDPPRDQGDPGRPADQKPAERQL